MDRMMRAYAALNAPRTSALSTLAVPTVPIPSCSVPTAVPILLGRFSLKRQRKSGVSADSADSCADPLLAFPIKKSVSASERRKRRPTCNGAAGIGTSGPIGTAQLGSFVLLPALAPMKELTYRRSVK